MSVSLQGHCTFVIAVSGVALTKQTELENQGRVRFGDKPPERSWPWPPRTSMTMRVHGLSRPFASIEHSDILMLLCRGRHAKIGSHRVG
jgi:hypothetical protein